MAPSFDEMKEALNLKSKSGIHRLITALEERGFVRRLPHRARAMEIVRLPMHGIADSLNVSVAAAVLLYEARRQRGLPDTANRSRA